MSMYCDILFPTFVIYKDNPNAVTDSIINFSRNLILENKDKPFHSDCYSTVNTLGNVFDYREFDAIKENVIDCLNAYLQRTRIKKNRLKFSCSWLNLYNKHGYQDLHMHTNSMLSGVFYIKSEGNKDLVFQSPSHFFQPIIPEYEELNLENCSNVEYNSNVGRCFIFPSHLMHKTLPATSERISLSFNIVQDNS